MSADEIRINTARNGRRFAFVGDYTVREGEGVTTVTRDIDGDEVRLATLPSFDTALALVQGAKA